MEAENRLTLGNNPLIGGVCDGIARHLSIDVILVRVIFAVLGLFIGGGIFIYLLFYWLIPRHETEGEIRRKKLKQQKRKQQV